MTTEPVSAPAIQIAFPEADPLPVAPEPPAPVSNGLATIAAAPEKRQGLVCHQLLQGPTLAQAQQEAAQLYPQMLADQSNLMSYGTVALEDLNKLVDRLLKEVEPVRIPQLNGMMKDLNVQMNAIKGKYDLNDKSFRQDYEDQLKGVKKFWRKAKDYVSMMKADILSIEKQLELLEKDLAGKQYDMTRNVVYYNQLYAENEVSIMKLIYVIGVMELIVEAARKDAQTIEVGDASLGDRGDEQRQLRADVITNLEVKIADYKGRLFVAWATSPQTRMMRNLDVGMAAKLNQLVQVTVPQMRLVLVQWRMLLESFEAAQTSEAVAAMSNQWTQEFFKTGAQVMPKIAEAINAPVVWPETMNVVCNSLIEASDGILAAYVAGDQKRADVDRAMLESQQALKDVHKKIDDTVIGQIVGQAIQPIPQPLALPSGR